MGASDGAPFQVVCGSDGRIDQQVTCIRCAYNLRGLAPDGACPECATPVERSIQGDCLYFFPPEWNERLARGMNWIVAGIVLGIVGPILSGLVLGPMWIGVTLPIATGLQVVGCWLVTTPEPARLENEPVLNVRRCVRFMAVFNYAAVWGFLLGSAWARFRFGPIGAAVLCLTAIIELVSAFVYAGRLAIRIPSWKLAKDCRELMWAWLILPVLVAVSSFIGGPDGSSGIAIAVACCATLAALILPVLTFMVILGLRWKLAETAALARQVWGKPVRASAETADSGI
jgi:hypothetical protein